LGHQVEEGGACRADREERAVDDVGHQDGNDVGHMQDGLADTGVGGAFGGFLVVLFLRSLKLRLQKLGDLCNADISRSFKLQTLDRLAERKKNTKKTKKEGKKGRKEGRKENTDVRLWLGIRWRATLLVGRQAAS
jgi:hypothetical protein